MNSGYCCHLVRLKEAFCLW